MEGICSLVVIPEGNLLLFLALFFRPSPNPL